MWEAGWERERESIKRNRVVSERALNFCLCENTYKLHSECVSRNVREHAERECGTQLSVTWRHITNSWSGVLCPRITSVAEGISGLRSNTACEVITKFARHVKILSTLLQAASTSVKLFSVEFCIIILTETETQKASCHVFSRLHFTYRHKWTFCWSPVIRTEWDALAEQFWIK